MGQSEVFNYLKKVEKPMSSREIAEALGATHAQVCIWLSKLIKYNEVSYIEVSREDIEKYVSYKTNRSFRVYYI